jgi:hypothetical protein
MQNAWGTSKLKAVEKLGEYSFKVEFVTENEKKRVLDGGPWRHKGDALILVHYDGLCRSSEVRINTFQVWVCFYDLPPMMMKEAFAKQLGGQIGTYIRMDNRYPSYLRVRVEFSLSKALVPSLKVEVKGRGRWRSYYAMRTYHTFVLHATTSATQLLIVVKMRQRIKASNLGKN